MKYYLDTEFLEGAQKKLFGRTKPTIDLISIGIVAEDGREYYAISKDFNLKEAWNRYDLVDVKYGNTAPKGREKVYWIRENVLRPIFDEIWSKNSYKQHLHQIPYKFTYSNFKKLINLYGKSNKIIAIETRNFIMETGIDYGVGEHTYTPIDIYTYYGDYDWVAFCWLFGRMIDLPTGFPMYSRDLKQILDEKAGAKDWYYGRDIWSNTNTGSRELQKGDYPATLQDKIEKIKRHDDYPQPENEHNALADARWNKKLYEFLQSY